MDDLQRENERLRHLVTEMESRSAESSLRSIAFSRSFDLGHALGHLRIARPQDDDSLIESYEEPVRESWKQSKGINWRSHEYLPLAKRLRHARLPRLDLEIFKAVAETHDRAVNICLETGTESKYQHCKAEDFCPDDDDFEIVWCNRAATETFGYDVESMKSWEARAKKTMKWIQLVQNATLGRRLRPPAPPPPPPHPLSPRASTHFGFSFLVEAVFVDENYQPFREVFFKYGQIDNSGGHRHLRDDGSVDGADGDWAPADFDPADDFGPADVLIMQVTPCFFRCSDGRVYFGTIEEPDAKLKHAREVFDRMVMPLAIFRYTEIALGVFDLNGNLLQQNATSMKVSLSLRFLLTLSLTNFR